MNRVSARTGPAAGGDRSPAVLAEALETRLLFDAHVPLADRRALVYDDARRILYITTSSGAVQRYNVDSGSLLTPWAVGTSLNGADIAPDGSALYVAGQGSGAQGRVHRVNLDTGAVTDLPYALQGSEQGGWDLVIPSAGRALFTGDATAPMRQIDLATGAVSRRTDYGGSGAPGKTLLDRAANRGLTFVSESTTADYIRNYDPAADAFSARRATDMIEPNNLSAVNLDGTRIAIEISPGTGPVHTAVVDRAYNQIRSLPGIDGGVAFDPTREVLYGVNSSTDQLIAFDANTWGEMFRRPIGENVEASTALGPGVMTVSGDALKLFLSTPTGVRVIDLPAPRDPTISFQISGIPSSKLVGPVQFTVTARGPGGAVDTNYLGIVRFTGSSPNDIVPAPYRFTFAHQGVHTFTATFGVPVSGSASITVADAGAPRALPAPATASSHTSAPSNSSPTPAAGTLYGTRPATWST